MKLTLLQKIKIGLIASNMEMKDLAKSLGVSRHSLWMRINGQRRWQPGEEDILIKNIGVDPINETLFMLQ